MKRIIISILLSLSCLFASGQEHLMFRGIPIEGNVTTFIQKCSQSFDYIVSSWLTNSVVMKGSFGGETNCNIFVYYTPISKEVYTVAISFSNGTNWNQLEQTYFKYKGVLQKKYSVTCYHSEYFDYLYELGDGDEMLALRRGKCHYKSIFETENGSILVMITNLDENGNIAIAYRDLVNAQKKKSEEQELIINSI